MKLFMTKRQFQGELKKVVSPLQKEIDDLNRIISNREYEYLSEKSELEAKNQKLLEKNARLEEIIILREEEIHKLEYDNRKINGAKGGLTRQVNKLEAELKEANGKLSQRYILKELVAERSRNTQVMKTKSGSKTSKIIKDVIESKE